MISLKLTALVVLTAVSVVAAGPPIRRSLSPLDVTLRSIPHPAPATPGACRGCGCRTSGRTPRIGGGEGGVATGEGGGEETEAGWAEGDGGRGRRAPPADRRRRGGALPPIEGYEYKRTEAGTGDGRGTTGVSWAAGGGKKRGGCRGGPSNAGVVGVGLRGGRLPPAARDGVRNADVCLGGVRRLAIRPLLVPGHGPASCDGCSLGDPRPAKLDGGERGRGAGCMPPRLGPREKVEEIQLVGEMPGM